MAAAHFDIVADLAVFVIEVRSGHIDLPCNLHIIGRMRHCEDVAIFQRDIVLGLAFQQFLQVYHHAPIGLRLFKLADGFQVILLIAQL